MTKVDDSSLLEFYDKMFKKQAQLEMACNNENDWNNMVLDSKRDIKIDSKISEDGLPMMRSQGWIESSAESVW